MTTYRVGNHQPQNLYRDDTYIGVMFTAEDAALVVEALNGKPECGASGPDGLWCERQPHPANERHGHAGDGELVMW